MNYIDSDHDARNRRKMTKNNCRYLKRWSGTIVILVDSSLWRRKDPVLYTVVHSHNLYGLHSVRPHQTSRARCFPFLIKFHHILLKPNAFDTLTIPTVRVLRNWYSLPASKKAASNFVCNWGRLQSSPPEHRPVAQHSFVLSVTTMILYEETRRLHP